MKSIRLNVLVSGFSLLLVFLTQIPANSQSAAAPTREERFARLEQKMIFPLIHAGPLSGVLPVENITNKPDPNKEVKLIFDFTQSTSKGHQADKINEGLEEVARELNLQVAAGTKPGKLKAVIIFHSGSVLTICNNAYYQKEYHVENPNRDILNQLTKAGVTFVVCGQSLALRDLSPSILLPEIQVALSAKTTITKYNGLGYYVVQIKES